MYTNLVAVNEENDLPKPVIDALVDRPEFAAKVSEIVPLATFPEAQAMIDEHAYMSPAALAEASAAAPTPNRLIRRDGSGRAQVDTPGAPQDIANKRFVEDTAVKFGTTTMRDAYYGAYDTVAKQVAIANQSPMWYNTTTRQWETFYAVNGSPGLSVPGLFAAGAYFPAGWYRSDSKNDWGGKSGSTNVTAAAFRTQWARQIDGGGVVRAGSNNTDILIGIDGVYEAHVWHRTSDNTSYVCLALDGSRDNMEKLAGGLDGTPISAIWTHGHNSGSSVNQAMSYFLGPLPAGSKITAGAQSVTNSLINATAASNCALTVRRID